MATEIIINATATQTPRETEKAKVDAILESVKESLKAKNLVEYSKGVAKLNSAIVVLNKAIKNEAYNKFMESDTPIIEAVKTFYVDAYKVTETRDKNDGVITDIELGERKVAVNLVDFCEECDLSTKWIRNCSKLLALLSLREKAEYALTDAELAKKSYYFIAQYKAKKAGETPDSNTQIVRLIQEIIDGAIFVDDGNGKNVYKVTNHDIKFIQDAVKRLDTKEKCTIAMLNEHQFIRVMMGVFAHCLGEAYKVKEAKMKKKAD